MARILILRHRPDADETAAAVAARGHLPVVLPLGAVAALDAPCPQGPFGGFLVTSANAVPALARRFPGERRPVLSVGARTAAALRAAGFADVAAGEGTGGDLAGPASELFAASGLPLLYAAGRVRTAGLEAELRQARVPVAVWEVYDVIALRPTDAAVAAAFAPVPDAVLLLSVGQAEGYAALVGRKGCTTGAEDGEPSRLLCLSDRIRAALPEKLRGAALISPRPRLSALFDRFL